MIEKDKWNKEIKNFKTYVPFGLVWRNIAYKRAAMKKDKKPSATLVQRKTMKHPLFSQLVKEMEDIDFVEDKK